MCPLFGLTKYGNPSVVSVGKINLPPLWDKIPPGQSMVAVQVKAGSDEFAAVEKSLKASAGNITSVVKVHIFILPGCTLLRVIQDCCWCLLMSLLIKKSNSVLTLLL